VAALLHSTVYVHINFNFNFLILLLFPSLRLFLSSYTRILHAYAEV